MEPNEQRIANLEAKVEALKEIVGDLLYAIATQSPEEVRANSARYLEDLREHFGK